VYQRTYTWGADQIDRLFEDIAIGLHRSEQAAGPPTFLGSVILFEGRGSVTPKINTALPAQVLHVVDGQQRLTTLLLILGRLRSSIQDVIGRLATPQSGASNEWIDANLAILRSQLSATLWVDLPSASGAYCRLPRLVRQSTDVWGDRQTNAKYESDVAYYLHGLALTELESAPPRTSATRPHLKLALDSIDEHLSNVLSASDEGSMLHDLAFVADLSALTGLLPLVPAESALAPNSMRDDHREAIRLAVFAQFLLSQVIVIDVRAPDEETAFSLFEPLNTTGQPLTPIETLRPLAVTAEGGLDTYVGSVSDQAFQRIGLFVPDELESTERTKRVSSLLTSFALCQDGSKLAHNMVEQRRYLREAYDASATLPVKRSFVEGIAETARFLSEVWEEGESPLITTGSGSDRLCLEVLSASGHVVVVPLLVRYYERAEQEGTSETATDFRDVVRAGAAFWTLWRSSRSTTSGIDDVHRSLIKTGLAATHLQPLARSSTSVNNLPTVRELKTALRSLLAAKASISDQAGWVTLVNSQPIYETAKILARYILLCAHDDVVPDPNADGHVIRGANGTWRTRSIDVWRNHYSVEHIAPQRKRSTDASYATALYDEGDISRLGNLTLLPDRLNSLIGNRDWPFKRDVYEMLAITDPQQRVAALKSGNLYSLSAKSKTLLESSDFIPFCRFVAMFPGPAIERSYIADRGKRLAELAWDRLWSDLN
jgi:hypothetical protein